MGYIPVTLHREITIEQLYTIHYFEYTSSFIFSGESHPFWEFLYVDKGEVLIHADEQELALKKDDIIFHCPDEFHSVRANGTIAPNLIIISFDCSSPCMSFFRKKVMRLSKSEQLLLAQIILEAGQLFSTPLDNPRTQKMERVASPPPGCEQLIQLYLEQLLLQLLRRHQTPAQPRLIAGSCRPEAEEAAYQQIHRYLEKHLHTQLTLAQICQDNRISYSHLVRLFRDRHNCSIMKYFSNMKLNAAKQLIRTQSLNFSQIADTLGYSSIHYFSRHFKATTGMTPTEYADSVKMLSEQQ